MAELNNSGGGDIESVVKSIQRLTITGDGSKVISAVDVNKTKVVITSRPVNITTGKYGGNFAGANMVRLTSATEITYNLKRGYYDGSYVRSKDLTISVEIIEYF